LDEGAGGYNWTKGLGKMDERFRVKWMKDSGEKWMKFLGAYKWMKLFLSYNG